MAASFTRGRFSRMLPLLSITRPMLTGISSRLKTESFCSALSSKTRKFSCLRPSAKRPRSSRTVVCSTTRFTLTEIGALPPELWPGGGGGAGGGGKGICAWVVAERRRHRPTATKSARAPLFFKTSRKRWLRKIASVVARLVTGRVVAGFVVNGERRKPARRTKLDLNFAPTRVVRLIARMISQDILIAQLHADLGSDIRQIFQLFTRENAPAGQFGDFAQ